MSWEFITTIIASLGGLELIKFFLNRSQHKRIAEAQADIDEFHVMRETIEFLQQQMKEKEERFAEQTMLVRKLNNEIIEKTKENGKLELELQKHRCVVPKCINREPQNGY